VGRAEQDLIHLTGPLQVVARAEMGHASDAAAQVNLRFDAGQMRGVGLKTGARYWVEGRHHSTHPVGNGCAAFEVTSLFALLGGALPGAPPLRLILTVRLRVLVPADGRVSVEALAVELLPDGGTGSSSPGSQEA